MSYDVHITRAEHWYASPEKPISLDELKDYFQGQSDVEYSEEFSISGPVSMSMSGHFFIWTHDGIKVPFMYTKGRLTVSRADDDVIEKMKEIAAGLNAKVQGDEGETY